MEKHPIKDFYETHYAKLDLTKHILERITLTEKALSLFLNEKGTIVEIGCGNGKNLRYYKERLGFKDAYCIEIASSAEDEIRRNGITPYIEDVNTSKLPFMDSSVNAVIFEEVIEHLYNSDLVLSEIHRVLKKGDNGILILSTPNLSSWINRLALFMGYQPFSHDVSFVKGFGRLAYKDQTNGHIKSFTLRAMIEYLEYFGFEVIDKRGLIADGIPSWLSALDRFFSHFPSLASHMFIVAKKEQ